MRAVFVVLMLAVAAAFPGAAPAVAAPAAPLQERLAPCLACHGESGQSANKEVPSLGGEPKDYVLIQLYMFREKLRKVELMNEMVKGFSDDDLRAFSEAIAKLPAPKPSADPLDPARAERAKAVIAQNRCNVCHKPDFSGQDQVPHLAGQREDYLLKALRDYKSNARAGYDATMAEVIQPITEANIVDLAHYLARVK